MSHTFCLLLQPSLGTGEHLGLLHLFWGPRLSLLNNRDCSTCPAVLPHTLPGPRKLFSKLRMLSNLRASPPESDE